ncbi:MAG: nuclear transport factor 2 family protein [Actinomycetota bacterium]
MPTPYDWVTGFLDRAGDGLDLDRVNERSPGLDATGAVEALGDPRLGEHAVEALTELLHPTDSMCFDAGFGAFHGQTAIRRWLMPRMGAIADGRVPTAPMEIFGDAETTSSVSEWQMWASVEGERVPMSRGVSIRHHREGWIVWNADVYDTSPMRRSAAGGEGTHELPEPPQVEWETQPMITPERSDALEEWLERPPEERGPIDHADIHTVMITPGLGLDPEIVVPLFHPTDSVLREPHAELVGAEAIARHLGARRESRMTITLESIGVPLFNGDCTAFEWVARVPGAEPPVAVRGTSVCRYADGLVVAATDYYDNAATR